MKTVFKLFFTLVLLTGIELAGMGQDRGNVIKINILSPILKTINLQYEKKLNSSSSFQFGFFYTAVSVGSTDFSGFGITPEYRFYLSNTEAPKGVYVAPFVRYQNFTLTDGIDKGTLSTFGGGLILGKQWLFKDRIALDIFLGPSYASGSVEVTSGSNSFDTGSASGFGLRAGIC